MLEAELKDIWKNSPETERIKFDLSRLMIDLNGRMDKIERAIRRRDREGFFTTIISIPVFAYLAYIIPFPLTKVGVVLAMIGFAWNIYKQRDHQKQKRSLNPTLSFREQLEYQKVRVLQEVKLLDTVLYWMLIPGFITYSISILGLGDPAEYGWSNAIIDQILPMPMAYKLGNLAFAVVVFAAICWTNKRIVNKTLKPMIRDIEDLLLQLENGH